MLIHLPMDRRKEARNACRALQQFTGEKLAKTCRRCPDENTNRCPLLSERKNAGLVISMVRQNQPTQPLQMPG